MWDSGVLCIEPAGPLTDRDLVVSSGIHGNETAPIELCFLDGQANFSRFASGTLIARELGREYRSGEGERIVFPNAHVPLGHRALALVRPCKLSESELV